MQRVALLLCRLFSFWGRGIRSLAMPALALAFLAAAPAPAQEPGQPDATSATAPGESEQAGGKVAKEDLPGTYVIRSKCGDLLVKLADDGVLDALFAKGKYELGEGGRFAVTPDNPEASTLRVTTTPGAKPGEPLGFAMAGLAAKTKEGFRVATDETPPCVYDFIRVAPFTNRRQLDGKWEPANSANWNAEDGGKGTAYLHLVATGDTTFHLRNGLEARGLSVNPETKWSSSPFACPPEGGSGCYTCPLINGQTVSDRYMIYIADKVMVRINLNAAKEGKMGYMTYKRDAPPSPGMPPMEQPGLTGNYLARGPWGCYVVKLTPDGSMLAGFAKGRYSLTNTGEMAMQMGDGDVLRGVLFVTRSIKTKASIDYYVLTDDYRKEWWLRRTPAEEQAALLKLFPLTTAAQMTGPVMLDTIVSFPPGGEPVVKRGLNTQGTMKLGVMTWAGGRQQRLLADKIDEGRFSLPGPDGKGQMEYMIQNAEGGGYYLLRYIPNGNGVTTYYLFYDLTRVKDGRLIVK